MAKETTSLRLEPELRKQLADAAKREQVPVTELMERFIREGLATASHPGVFFNPGPSGRRATVVGGPDVWEIVDSLRSMRGTERARVRSLARMLELREEQIVIAIEYAAAHPEEIEERIRLNEQAMAAVERATEARARLLS